MLIQSCLMEMASSLELPQSVFLCFKFGGWVTVFLMQCGGGVFFGMEQFAKTCNDIDILLFSLSLSLYT